MCGWPYYPQYYIPVPDVRRDLLIPEGHTQRSRRGTAEAHALRAGRVQRSGGPAAHRLAGPGLADMVRFDWAALDAWFEEDGQAFVHPRNPYVRVNALRWPARCASNWTGSSRRVGVTGHGVRDRADHAVLHQPGRGQLRPRAPHKTS